MKYTVLLLCIFSMCCWETTAYAQTTPQKKPASRRTIKPAPKLPKPDLNKEKKLLTKTRNKRDQNALFNSFKEGFLAKYWQLNPGSAAYNGLEEYNKILQVPNEKTFKMKKNFYNRFLSSLKRFKLDELSAANKTDYALIKSTLEASIWYLDNFKAHEWNPSIYNIGGGFDRVLTSQELTNSEKLNDIAHKMINVPDYFEAARKNIHNPTREHTDLAILQTKGMLQVFEKDVQAFLDKATKTDYEGVNIDKKILEKNYLAKFAPKEEREEEDEKNKHQAAPVIASPAVISKPTQNTKLNVNNIDRERLQSDPEYRQQIMDARQQMIKERGLTPSNSNRTAANRKPAKSKRSVMMQQLRKNNKANQEKLKYRQQNKNNRAKKATAIKYDTYENKKDIVTERLKQALASIKAYAEWLESSLRPSLASEKTRNFRIGKDVYEQKFKHDIQSVYTATEIYEKALAEKERIHQKMFEITDQIWSKYMGQQQQPADKLQATKQLINKIAEKHVSRTEFLPAIKKQLPELTAFVQKKNLLTLDLDKPLEVRETPKYMRGVAGASISSPGPYEKKRPTYYNVTPLDHYSPEEAESYLREYNYYILQILNIHEAIPGHYAQLVYSNKAPSLIKTIFGNGAMIEGWACYTERMMLEEGYGNNEPEMWLMYYKWNLRIVCNTILDYGIHVKNMSESEVLSLLTDEAFQETTEAKNKWRRATLSQVQLTSYFTGLTEIYEFREQLKKEKGNLFNLKKFHEDFLSYGSAPVKEVKTLMTSTKKSPTTQKPAK